MVVAVSGAAIVHRCDLLLPKTAARILLACGFAMVGWLCAGALLSSTASAEEQKPGEPETVSVQHGPSEEQPTEEPASEQPAAEVPATEKPSVPAEEATGSGETTTPAETPSPDSGPNSGSGSGSAKDSAKAELPATAEPAPAPDEELEATDETAAVSSANSVETKKAGTSKPSIESTATNFGGGLLSGLLGPVLNAVTTTVSGILQTVGGVVDTVRAKALAPIVVPGICNPGKPAPLPGLDDVLDPVLDGSNGSASATVTVSVPTRNIVSGETTPALPDPRPLVPAEAPAPAATPHHRIAFPVQVQLNVQTTPATPAESGTHAAPDSGGSGGGGGLPSAPVAPAAPTTSAHPGQDTSGGGRGPLAVLDSGMSATQLKLIGAGCDHEGERTGREAALPATSPD